MSRRVIPIGTTALLEQAVHNEGEISYNTETNKLHLGDGVTVGGVPVDAASVGFIQSGTGAAATNLQARGRLFVFSTDYDSLQEAIDAVYASGAGGGEVCIPGDTNVAISTAIVMRAGVNLVGMGVTSIITATSCDAITYDYYTGSGNSRISNLLIQGAGTTTHTAIKQIGSLDDSQELYGITISNVLIRDFNVGVHFRQVRNVNFENNWLQDVNSGIELVGKVLVFNFAGKNTIVYAAGNGTGTQRGLYCDYFNFTSGTGNVRPESVKADRGLTIYGFTRAVDMNAVVYGLVKGADIQATGEAVRFSTVETFILDDNYIQVASATGSAAVRGLDQSSVIGAKVSIKGNNINAVNTNAGTSVGVLLGLAAGTGNSDHVDIENNDFNGFTLSDIEVHKSGNIVVRANQCRSSATTQTMLLTGLVAGRPVHVYENVCAKTIAYSASLLETGALQLGTNVVSGSTMSYGPSGEPVDVAFNAGDFTANGAMTFTVTSGLVEKFAWTLNGKMMTVFIKIAGGTVGGTLDSQLKIKIPAGRTAVGNDYATIARCLDNSVEVEGWMQAETAGTNIICSVRGANWSAGAAFIYGQITFEVQ